MPPRISVYHDLPFAIMRYNPTDEWELRREVKLLATRLEAAGKEVHVIPMSELLWWRRASHQNDDEEGLEAIIELERERGFEAAQRQVTTYLSDNGVGATVGVAREASGGTRPGELSRLPDARGGDVAGNFPHVEASRQDAG